jgi:hypothetical protein
MPHPSKIIKIPRWIKTNEAWVSMVNSCNTPQKFSVLATDLLKDRVFDTLDELWLIIYLIAEDIQNKHNIFLFYELDKYRLYVFNRNEGMRSLLKEQEQIERNAKIELYIRGLLRKEEEKEENVKLERYIMLLLKKEAEQREEAKIDLENNNVLESIKNMSISKPSKNDHDNWLLEKEEEKEKNTKLDLENNNVLDSIGEESKPNSSEFRYTCCDSDCYSHSDSHDSDCSDPGDVGGYTEVNPSTINEESQQGDCEEKLDLNKNSDSEKNSYSKRRGKRRRNVV